MSANNDMNNLGVTAAIAEEVGKRLRQAREARRLSTNQVAQKIRVREHYLVAIENADWNTLPPGLNGRGLVRLYGRELQVALPELDPKGGAQVTNAADAGFDVHVQTRPATPQDRIPSQRGISHSPPASLRDRGGSGTPPLPRPPAPPARREPPNLRSVPPTPALNVNDEEAPLDVVTPDLAAILGLQAEDFDELKGDPRGGVPLPEPERIPDGNRARAASGVDVPPVDAEELARDMFDDAPLTRRSEETEAEAPASQPPSSQQPRESKAERQRRKAEQRAQRNQTESQTPASAEPQTAEPRAEMPPVEPPPLAPHFSAEKTIAVPTAASSTRLPIAPPALSEPPSGGDEPPARGGKGRKWLVPLLGGAALVLGIIFYVSQHDAEEDSQAALPTSAPIIVSVTEAGPEPAEVNVIASGESIGDAVAPQAAETRVVTRAPAATHAPAASHSPVATHAPAAVHTQAATPAPTRTATPAAAPTATGTAAVNGTPAAVAPKGVRIAKLEVLEEVGLQATADGKVVLTGRSTAGTYSVEFKNSAEIFVDDGSKVKLSYEGWDHGPLGQPGRRRRILLNAQPYDTQP